VSSSSTGGVDWLDALSFALSFAGSAEVMHLVAVGAMIIGTLWTFLGVRLFRVTLFLIAFVCVCGFVYYFAMLSSGGDSQRSFIAAMVVGVVAGALVSWVYRAGIMLAGAFAAFTLWEAFISTYPHAVPNAAEYSTLGVVLGLGGIAAWFARRWALLLATPILGVFLFAQGLAKYVRDPSLRVDVFAAMHGDVRCETQRCLGLDAGFAGAAALGLLVQWRWTSGMRDENVGAPQGEERGIPMVESPPRSSSYR
jgi:hypothetical protein